MYKKCIKTGHFCPAYLGIELKLSPEIELPKEKNTEESRGNL